MERVEQPPGERGSLKWIQRAVNCHRDVFNQKIAASLRETGSIDWKSPLIDDDFAEYRDGAFLDRIGHSNLRGKLSCYWPSGGPQWDALATTTSGNVLLVEAKAHIGEICSSGSKSSGPSRLKIENALAATASYMGAKNPKAPWIETFYQLANRFAHLYFLRENKVKASLILVNFILDEEMEGPQSPAEWRAAYKIVSHVMGIPWPNRLSKHVLHLYPSVEQLPDPAEAGSCELPK